MNSLYDKKKSFKVQSLVNHHWIISFCSPQGSEIETAATIAVDHKPMDVNDSSSADAAETTISSSVGSKLMAPKLSPESNKENKSSNSSTSVSSGSAQIKLSALQVGSYLSSCLF